MPIRPSASAEIGQLLVALRSDDEVRRETAIARLAVIGPRAVEHLVQEFPSATGRDRAAILRALEAIGDPRALPLAREALKEPATAVETAAIGVIRALLPSEKTAAARDAFELLVAVALDRTRGAAARIAAFDALPADAREPLRATLAADDDADVRMRTSGSGAAPEADDAWRKAVDGALPAAPAILKQAVAARRTVARLTELQRLIDHVRAREQRESDLATREEWRAVRGAIHQALAARNSRLALYDLRDSLMESDRLPVAFLAALEDIGDPSCLEALAGAYETSSRSGDTWWREHVATAFRAIVHREGLTRRHAAVKRALARWPDAASDLLNRC